MSQYNTIEGELIVSGSTFGIAVARFNSFVVESLLDGAVDCLQRHGAKSADIEVVRVPGAFELPLAVQRMAATKKYDAIIIIAPSHFLPFRGASIFNGDGYATPIGTAEIDKELAKSIADRKSTRLNSSHIPLSRMPSSA